MARAEDNIEIQLQNYLTIRKHVQNFDTILQLKLEKLEEGPAEDLVNKLSILLAYDFEAAVRLKQWDDLAEIILKADICKSMKVFELMADCMLCCEAPTNGMIWDEVLNRRRVDADSLYSNNSKFKENSERSMGARKLRYFDIIALHAFSLPIRATSWR